MKSFLYATAVAIAAFGVSSNASATEFFGGAIALSGGPVNYTGGFTATHTTDFVDTWTFGPLPAGLADASVINISFEDATDINFTEATLNGLALQITNGAPVATAITLSQIFSAGGTNTLIIKGLAGSNASYSGTVNYTVSPVPEPATWAMMIGGFGLVGGAMRRRTRNVAVAFG
jgi:hypothetical protein